MKVLMFGWEFPPHISGGLGTACFGLTKGLMDEKIKVLFVVPRLYGDEPGKNAFLINASGVLKGRAKARTRRRAKEKELETIGSHTPVVSSAITVHEQGMACLRVHAALSPYTVPLSMQGVGPAVELMSWNYSIASNQPARYGGPEKLFMAESAGNTKDVRDEEAFVFSGTYGENLLAEVDRFARVGGIISGQHDFDVIHVHDWMTFLAGMTAKSRSGKPLVVHVHSTEFDRAGANVNQSVLAIEKRGLIEADKIIAVSNWTKQMIVSHYNIPEDKVTVVHNGILRRDTPEIFDFPNIASHFITFLGRVTHQKGPWYFVEAAQKVRQEFPDAHFIVAGAGDLLPQIIERVAQLNMSESFHFTGFLSEDQVDKIWSMTDVYVMPSVSEPFGIAPLEAIQGGVPVILSNQSGVAEVMPHAIKVDFWDTTALAAAICSVLRYESLSDVLRQYSKQHIEHLTWEKAARDVKSVYHELIAQRQEVRN